MLSPNLAQHFEYLDCLYGLSGSPNTLMVERTNSLVGLIIRAPSPSIGPHFFRYSVSNTGIKKAKVLPEPVLAAPSTSLPFSAKGIAFIWIGVISVKKAAERPSAVGVHKGSWEKVLYSLLVSCQRLR